MTEAGPDATRHGSGRSLLSGLRRRGLEGAQDLLGKGASPEGLALSLAVGACLGLFPIIGVTTALCLLAGAFFRLNHAALQLGNYAMMVPQLLVLLPLVRLGESLTGVSPLPLNPLELVPLFRADPQAFLARFGATGLRGILGWAVLAPLFVAVAYYTLRSALRGLTQGLGRLGPRPPEAA